MIGLLAVLAGCGGNQDSAAADPVQAECDRAAYDDPVVKDLMTRRIAAADNDPYGLYGQVLNAHKQAMVRCLRSRGIGPPGGVEPVKRSY